MTRRRVLSIAWSIACWTVIAFLALVNVAMALIAGWVALGALATL